MAATILAGDTNQLKPVAGGAPMVALSRLLGSSRIATIKRQQADWMKRASMAFAAGHGREAIEAYARRGAIRAIFPERESAGAVDHGKQAATQRSYARLIDAASESYCAKIAADAAGDMRRILMIAGVNETVRDLNAAVRSRLKQQGILGDGIAIRAVPRGATEAIEMEVATGDRVIFGENAEVAGTKVFNADFATVSAIDRTNMAAPALTFVLDRLNDAGNPITFRAPLNALIGKRPGSTGTRRGQKKQAAAESEPAPRMQHAFAVTVHASQGMTVDHAIVVNAHGLSAEQTYVGMTRHRHTVEMLVDAEKILSRRPDVALGLRGGALVRSDELASSQSAALSNADRLAKLTERLGGDSERRSIKSNPSDTFDDLEAWLDATDPVSTFKAPRPTFNAPDLLLRRMARRKALPPVAACERRDATRLTAAERKVVNAVPPLETLRQAGVLARLERPDPAIPVYRMQVNNRMIDGRDRGNSIAVDQESLAHINAYTTPTDPVAVKLIAGLFRWPAAAAREVVRLTHGLFAINPLAQSVKRRNETSSFRDGLGFVDSAALVRAARLASVRPQYVAQATQAGLDLEDDGRRRHRRRSMLRALAGKVLRLARFKAIPLVTKGLVPAVQGKSPTVSAPDVETVPPAAPMRDTTPPPRSAERHSPAQTTVPAETKSFPPARPGTAHSREIRGQIPSAPHPSLETLVQSEMQREESRFRQGFGLSNAPVKRPAPVWRTCKDSADREAAFQQIAINSWLDQREFQRAIWYGLLERQKEDETAADHASRQSLEIRHETERDVLRALIALAAPRRLLGKAVVTRSAEVIDADLKGMDLTLRGTATASPPPTLAQYLTILHNSGELPAILGRRAELQRYCKANAFFTIARLVGSEASNHALPSRQELERDLVKAGMGGLVITLAKKSIAAHITKERFEKGK